MKLKFDITAQEYTIVKAVLEQTLGSSCDVWVYGSRAKNRADFNSDLDLAVDCQDKIPAKILAGLHASFNEAKLAFTVDVVDLNDVEPRFRQIITQQKVPFPLSGMAPKLRFPGFDGEWEEKRLGEVASFSKGKGISKDNISENGNLECIRYGQLYTDYAETIRKVKSRTNIPANELVLSESNDIIIPASGETQIDISKASCVLAKGVALGGDINIIKTKHDGVFLSYYLNSEKRYDIARLSQGISVVHLYADQLKQLNLYLPSIPEQQKIAGFLTSVDTRIEQLGRKKALWEQYKKGMMQKLFSREIRFRDDQGNDFPDWEEKKVADIFHITRGNVLAVKQMTQSPQNSSIYPVYSSQTKNNGLIGYYSECLYENAITWTTDGANAGEVKYRKGKFYCTNVCGVLISDDGYANQCISEMLNKITRKYVSYVGNPKLMNNVMALIKINSPSVPEQQKIAGFLSAIDRKIDHINTQLEQARTFKKGLLQQMFV